MRKGELPADEVIDISVILKPMRRAAIPATAGTFLSREDFAAQHGADPGVIDKLKEFAAAHNLRVLEASPERRTVQLEGTIKDLTQAFGVKLEQYQHEGRDYRARTGAIHVPADISGSIEAVLGFDNRPQAKTHLRVRDGGGGQKISAHTQDVSYNPPQVAALYNFPAGTDGTGQTIGIIELGGGYKAADLTKYFKSIGVKEPSVTAVLVDKAKNHPTTASSADGEVLLDIEVAGAVAPGAKIVVYFTPNTDQGFQDALTTAIHDATHKPSVISISWGGAESTWTAQAMTAFDSAAQDAAALGVTICAASGDNGSSDGVGDGANHVDFPASSPHVLGCGGTNLQSSNGKILSETVWNDSAQGGAGGGGYSVRFALPAWQAAAKIKPPANGGRGVPDVSGDADPETGYNVLVDGQSMVIGGTSAVAPLWSGLIARLNQKLGTPVGFLQPTLYALPASAGAFHDITVGSNGAYSAGPGWDAASGLGSPAGQNLLTALSAARAVPENKT
ncbi:MAG: S53 family peptidase [Bryobacteraceae bacterium]